MRLLAHTASPTPRRPHGIACTASPARHCSRTRSFEELAAHKLELEQALEEVHDRIARYESEYGLEDAVREQEQLREAIRKRDADVTRLTSTVAEQLDQYDKLEEVCRRLCERCGLGRDADIWRLYSDAELRTTIQSTVER